MKAFGTLRGDAGKRHPKEGIIAGFPNVKSDFKGRKSKRHWGWTPGKKADLRTEKQADSRASGRKGNLKNGRHRSRNPRSYGRSWTSPIKSRLSTNTRETTPRRDS